MTDVTIIREEDAGDITLIRDNRMMAVRITREVVAGPRGIAGKDGKDGERGQPGPPGDSVIADPGDLTLIFENILI